MLENINACTLICILLAVALCRCRKYDIEQQAQALYGESLRSVVERFRRTPEYLAILSDEVAELDKRLQAVSDRLAFVFTLQLNERVAQEMGGNLSLRYNSENFRRMGSKWQKPQRRARHQLKQKSPANMLDNYDKFHDPLTLAERNRVRELGFEYFGKTIHAMLERMVPDDHLPMSTLQPGGGDQQCRINTF